MAVCAYCKGEMTDDISCRGDALLVGGVTVHPIRWGDEKEAKGWRIDFCCRDCGTPPGGVHHPGCCVERCPSCHGQAVGCGCFDLDEDDDQDEVELHEVEDQPSRRLTRVVRATRYRPLCRAHRFRRHHLR